VITGQFSKRIAQSLVVFIYETVYKNF
jgi:hypothetical protein